MLGDYLGLKRESPKPWMHKAGDLLITTSSNRYLQVKDLVTINLVNYRVTKIVGLNQVSLRTLYWYENCWLGLKKAVKIVRDKLS